jgi:hypothetical protein
VLLSFLTWFVSSSMLNVAYVSSFLHQSGSSTRHRFSGPQRRHSLHDLIYRLLFVSCFIKSSLRIFRRTTVREIEYML